MNLVPGTKTSLILVTMKFVKSTPPTVSIPSCFLHPPGPVPWPLAFSQVMPCRDPRYSMAVKKDFRQGMKTRRLGQ